VAGAAFQGRKPSPSGDGALRFLTKRLSDRSCDKFNATAAPGGALAKPGQTTSDFQKHVSPKIKNISLHNSVNQNYKFRHPGQQEGRFAIVTMRGPECDGRFGVRRVFRAGRKRQGVRRSRVVLAPRCWR